MECKGYMKDSTRWGYSNSDSTASSVCYSVAEFGGLFGILYATFFEVVYYYLYLAYTQHFKASMIVLGIYAVYNTIIFLIFRRNRQKCCDKPHTKEEPMPLPFRI